MQSLGKVKEKGQQAVNSLLEEGKKRPDEVKTWGLTAGGAVVGALAVTAAAKGVITVLATLASPPIAMTLGAVGGGVLGWNFIHRQQEAEASAATKSEYDTEPVEVPVEVPVEASVEASVEVPVDSAVAATAEATPLRPAASEETVGAHTVVSSEPVAPVLPADPMSLADSATGTIQPTMPTEVDEAPAPASVTVAVPSPIPIEDTPEPIAPPTEADDLEAINGIGPVYAGRLHNAGIQRFAQLANLTPERIHEIIGPIRSGNMIEAEHWISEARQLMGGAE